MTGNARMEKRKARAAAQLPALLLSLCACGASGQSASFTLEEVSLNPTNFFVALRFSFTNTNLAPDYYMALYGYDGPPVGFTGAPRVRVSDCYHVTNTSLLLVDTSSPLPLAGRTYDAFVTRGEPCCLEPTGSCNRVLYKDEVFAPYPFLTNPVVSGVCLDVTSLVAQIRITVGQDLYTNSHSFPLTDPSGFFRLLGTNLFPTNAAIEYSTDPKTWH